MNPAHQPPLLPAYDASSLGHPLARMNRGQHLRVHVDMNCRQPNSLELICAPGGVTLPQATRALVPLQTGYVEQPQNELPAFAPRLAVLMTIALPHLGQPCAEGVVAVGIVV